MKKIRQFFKRDDGSIIVEAALFMPILISLILLSIETSRFILVNQKVSRVSATVNDLLARVEDPDQQLSDILNIAGAIMEPFNIGNNSLVVTSMVTKEEGQASRIAWQDEGAGTGTFTSQFGELGDSPEFPGDFTMNNGEVVLITEVFYRYEPLFGFSFWEAQNLYKSAFHRPRVQDISVLNGS